MCPTSKGGFGLRRVEDELGNQMVTWCVKMLSSPKTLLKGLQQFSVACSTEWVDAWFKCTSLA